MERKIKFICKAVKWFDKVNGNTYHSVKVTRVKDNAVIVDIFQYGYGSHYQQTALVAMYQAGWLPKKYNKDNVYGNYERENNYPIYWDCVQGTDKRQTERVESMNKLFKALRHKKAQVKMLDKTYEQYKQELINIQTSYIKMNKLI